MVNVFSRTAREGATSTTIIKGDRKLTRTAGNGEIVDLDQEKLYTVDFDRKTYSVKTFAELRREYEEQKERAEKNASRQGKSEKREGPEMEVDFDIKSTGNKDKINGWKTHEEIVTITVHEKGKKIEQSGGWVLTNDIWMGSEDRCDARDLRLRSALRAEDLWIVVRRHASACNGDGRHSGFRKGDESVQRKAEQLRRNADSHQDDVRGSRRSRNRAAERRRVTQPNETAPREIVEPLLALRINQRADQSHADCNGGGSSDSTGIQAEVS